MGPLVISLLMRPLCQLGKSVFCGNFCQISVYLGKMEESLMVGMGWLIFGGHLLYVKDCFKILSVY